MKKWVKILLIVLISIFVVASLFVLWQWKNIKSIYIGMNESPEEITRRRNENQVKLVGEIEKYLDGNIRALTPEEKKKIESGEVMAEEIYKQIFEEKHNEIVAKNEVIKPVNSDEPSGKGESSQTEKNSSSDKKGKSENSTESTKSSSSEKTSDSSKTSDSKKSTGNNSSSPEKKATTKDEIVIRYMSELYSLQSEYTAKAELTIKEGAHYYEEKKDVKDKAAARTDTITHYTPKVRSLEAECDKKVEAIVANLEKELKAIGADTDIARTIEEAYETEKQLKLSYYSNKYLT